MKFLRWLSWLGVLALLVVGSTLLVKYVLIFTSTKQIPVVSKLLGNEVVDRPVIANLTILAPTTTVDSKLFVAGHTNVVCAIDTVSATATIKFAGSIQDSAPTFTSAASSSNQYAYVSFTDIESNSVIAGNTGLVLTNSTTHRLVSLNAPLLKWVSVTNTVAVSGNVYVQCKLGSGV